MTIEEKQLLLTDLCARLPYRPKGVKLYELFDPKDITIIGYTGRFIETYNDEIPVEKVRLYLRPFSSMTEEEKETLRTLKWTKLEHYTVDWLNAHYLDYRGLINKGLALEAPEGMYKMS